MPDSKKRASKEAEGEATWLFAFADPARLTILRALAGGPKTMKELAAATGLPPSNVSPHIARMRRVGLVASVRRGNFRTCSLVGATVKPDYFELSRTSGLKVLIPRH
jgi:DNA-binding transcriptional ArsR family regulator